MFFVVFLVLLGEIFVGRMYNKNNKTRPHKGEKGESTGEYNVVFLLHAVCL